MFSIDIINSIKKTTNYVEPLPHQIDFLIRSAYDRTLNFYVNSSCTKCHLTCLTRHPHTRKVNY